MCSSVSKSEGKDSHDAGMESVPRESEDPTQAHSSDGKIDYPRLLELMQALQRIVRLQREVAWSQSISRQKIREAAFKRRDVWIRDADFMTEIQRLVAEGKLAAHEKLLYLASQCQASRDGLGQLEQEAIDIEQEWHGHSWKLRQAEIGFYTEFRKEFKEAETYPAGPSSDLSSTSGFSSEIGSQEQDLTTGQMIYRHQAAGSATSTASVIFNAPKSVSSTKSGNPSHNYLVPDTEQTKPREFDADYDDYSDLDSGVEKIDGPDPGETRPVIPKCQSEQLSQRISSTIKLFPQLLVDFSSRRDRINKWLEDVILDSHLESTSLFSILQARMSLEHKEMPSNWSQLVIAFWEHDEAATPYIGPMVDSSSCEDKAADNVPSRIPTGLSFGNAPTPKLLQDPVEIEPASSSQADAPARPRIRDDVSNSSGSDSLSFDLDNLLPSPPKSHENSELGKLKTWKDKHKPQN